MEHELTPILTGSKEADGRRLMGMKTAGAPNRPNLLRTF